MNAPVLAFVAEDVGAETTEYTPKDVVHLIGFGTGDPESDGHSWSFSRSFDEDWGVCTVREIQRATIYEGIASFKLHRTGIECVFQPKAASEVGFSELRVAFDIDDETWARLAATAKVIFRDRAYFACER